MLFPSERPLTVYMGHLYNFRRNFEGRTVVIVVGFSDAQSILRSALLMEFVILQEK